MPELDLGPTMTWTLQRFTRRVSPEAPKRFVYFLRNLANPNRTCTGLTSDVATRLGAHWISEDGHRVLIQRRAGIGSGYEDCAYADAELVGSAEEILERSDLVVKVKKPWPRGGAQHARRT